MSGTVKSRIWGDPNLNGGGGSGGGGTVSDILYNGQRPIIRNIPGAVGVNTNTTTLKTFLDALFFPAVAPGATLSVNNPIRETGQSTAYTLSRNAIKNTNPITGITVAGTVKTPTGNTQSGTQTGNTAASTGTFNFAMSDTDGTLNGAANCSIQYLDRMFWGTTAKNGGSSPILDSDILALVNSALVTNKNLSLANFGGGNTYLIFAFPSSFGTPAFTVNGLANTAFTKVRSASNFVNAQGATIVMDVWVSNNLYNSPLGTIVIS